MLLIALASLVSVLPPVAYDHVPTIPPDYQTISEQAMQLICFRGPNAPLIYSCSRMNRLGWCQVYLPDINDVGWPERLDKADVAMLKRHENGHCNGAPADHRGWRVG